VEVIEDVWEKRDHLRPIMSVSVCR